MPGNKYHIGCSGFYYKDWIGKFYPEDLEKKKWLEYYSEYFDTVEINNSFYRMPKESTVQGWYQRTPRHFKFTLKGSRYITHIKRLKEVSESIHYFYHLADQLAEKLGCILWQLPPNMKKDIDRLTHFINNLSLSYQNVIEFRHISWFDDEVYQTLRNHKIGFCIVSAPDDLPEDVMVTADFAYIRFHGKTNWYDYDYDQKQLKWWQKKIEAIDAKEIYIYFNNDYKVRAVKYAQSLMKLLHPDKVKV